MTTQNLAEGKRLDSYFDTVSLLSREYSFVECRHCHRVEPVSEASKDWKLDLAVMLIRKPVLGVAVGVCRSCVNLDREFRELERKLEE